MIQTTLTKTNNLEDNLRIDCYLAVLQKYRALYPQAHFEIITRTAKSVLSPSWDLLKVVVEPVKKLDLSFEEQYQYFITKYKPLFLEEMSKSQKAQERMRFLRSLAKDRIVFLVCYEKDQRICHRSLVKDLILSLK